jgi:hypothetical protein
MLLLLFYNSVFSNEHNSFSKLSVKGSLACNSVVSNHVNSDHVPSFSCHDVWDVRQTTSGVFAITMTTSTYHSRRCGTLYVIVIWRRQENGWVNISVRYLTVCLITEIYQDVSFSFHDSFMYNHSSKYRKKTNLIFKK